MLYTDLQAEEHGNKLYFFTFVLVLFRSKTYSDLFFLLNQSIRAHSNFKSNYISIFEPLEIIFGLKLISERLQKSSQKITNDQ